MLFVTDEKIYNFKQLFLCYSHVSLVTKNKEKYFVCSHNCFLRFLCECEKI